MSQAIFEPGTPLKFTGNELADQPELVLGELLGSGEGVQVYQGTPVGSAEVVACKVVLSPKRSLTEEAKIMQQFVDHPNIVAVRAFGRATIANATSRKAWRGELMVMEQGGPSLQTYVRRGAGVTIETGMRVVDGVSQALTAVHAAELVHRDVTPANILLGAGAVQLCDFELAKKIAAGHAKPEGTKYFAAPEQMKGGLSVRGDVYGLAASVYAGLAGRVPVPTVLLLQPSLRPYVQLNAWDERYEAIEPVLRKGFHRTEARRQADAATFSDEMHEAYQQGAAEKAQRERRRHV